MTDARTEGGEGQQTGEAVAEIGPGWQLLWYSRDTMVNIIARTGLKTGDLLYRHPPANPASREALARIAELEAELERANNWNEQVTGFGLDRLDELADAWIERTEITRLFSAVSSVFAKWANDDIIDRFKQAQADLAHLSYVEGAISGANIALALQPASRESELREAIERFVADYDDDDRADAGIHPLMELHVAAFRKAVAHHPDTPPACDHPNDCGCMLCRADAIADHMPGRAEPTVLEGENTLEYRVGFRVVEMFAVEGWPVTGLSLTGQDFVDECVAIGRTALEGMDDPAQEEGVLIPRNVYNFLMGNGDIDGYWFGDRREDERGAFWWRKRMPAHTPAPQIGEAAEAWQQFKGAYLAKFRAWPRGGIDGMQTLNQFFAALTTPAREGDA